MPDLLVPLYKLPPRNTADAILEREQIIIRRPMTYELAKVSAFIVTHFSRQWADEVAATFSRQPITSFIALENNKVVGFAAFETTTRGFFGPTGVAESHRKRGIGQALLLSTLWGMYDYGYSYGIIGSAGPVDFYQKVVPGTSVIEGSNPGIYPPTIVE